MGGGGGLGGAADGRRSWRAPSDVLADAGAGRRRLVVVHGEMSEKYFQVSKTRSMNYLSLRTRSMRRTL